MICTVVSVFLSWAVRFGGGGGGALGLVSAANTPSLVWFASVPGSLPHWMTDSAGVIRSITGWIRGETPWKNEMKSGSKFLSQDFFSTCVSENIHRHLISRLAVISGDNLSKSSPSPWHETLLWDIPRNLRPAGGSGRDFWFWLWGC